MIVPLLGGEGQAEGLLPQPDLPCQPNLTLPQQTGRSCARGAPGPDGIDLETSRTRSSEFLPHRRCIADTRGTGRSKSKSSSSRRPTSP